MPKLSALACRAVVASDPRARTFARKQTHCSSSCRESPIESYLDENAKAARAPTRTQHTWVYARVTRAERTRQSSDLRDLKPPDHPSTASETVPEIRTDSPRFSRPFVYFFLVFFDFDPAKPRNFSFFLRSERIRSFTVVAAQRRTSRVAIMPPCSATALNARAVPGKRVLLSLIDSGTSRRIPRTIRHSRKPTSRPFGSSAPNGTIR